MQVAVCLRKETRVSQRREKRSGRRREGASRENRGLSQVQRRSNRATAEIAVGERKTAVGERKTAVGERKVGVRMLDLAAEPCSNARMASSDCARVALPVTILTAVGKTSQPAGMTQWAA